MHVYQYMMCNAKGRLSHAELLLLLADEIDAIGTKRYESQSGGEREIQRTMLELLNQMDGFDSMGDVKVSIAWCSHVVGAVLRNACRAGSFLYEYVNHAY